MNRCRKRLSIVFGAVLALAALLAPFRETRVTYRMSPVSTLISKETRQLRGHALIFEVLHGREQVPDLEALDTRMKLREGRPLASSWRSLDLPAYLLQVGAVAILGVFDIWLFCPRRRRGQERADRQ